jgi:general secretion pathway protein F
VKFYYEGIELVTRQAIQGELEAVSEQEVVRLLSEQRIEALMVRPSEQKRTRGRRVTSNDLVLPLQELATLTAQGVTLIDALQALSDNEEHPNLARGFAKICTEIEGGKSFAEAIVGSSLPFPAYVPHLVEAGEVGGLLTEALSKASHQLNYDQSVREDMRGALTYPLVLIAAGIVAMLIIFFAVVPKFTHLLDAERQLPALAQLVLNAGRFANEAPWMLVGGAIVMVSMIVIVFSNAAVRHTLLNVAIELPVVGAWLAEQDAARWASLCSAMLYAKVSLLTALTLASESCDYDRRRHRARLMIKDVEEGDSFSEALRRARLVPATSLNLVSVGDKTGQLAEMLGAVSELHDVACKRRMKQVLTLLEPLAILLIGIVIGVMIMGIVQAITASTDIAI